VSLPHTDFTLLFVDDDATMLSMLEILFAGDGYRILTASDAETALSLVEKTSVDAALVDLQLPGMDGISLLKELRRRCPHAEVCIMTGRGGIRDAVAAIKGGAVDFLEKPLVPGSLKARVSRMHKVWKLRQENALLREERLFHFGYDRLVGNSLAMRALKSLVTRIAATDTSVLILGETGSGKELVARAIHALSDRASRAFVTVDCASISETLMESEIFGHEKGAFTGADAANPGLVRAAEGGSIFFDEIGELPLHLQAKMLRVLQEHEVRPVGSAKNVAVDARVIAASNRDLAREVARKEFREDLYYRLNVLVVRVPSLRERWEDIPLLAQYFMDVFKADSVIPREISPDALERMESYEWPGNVREMENVIRRALVLGRDAQIGPADLPPEISGAQMAASRMEGTLAASEAAAIRNALARAGGRRKQAARILGIGEATLYRKINECALRDDPTETEIGP
jgi:DNA-binding NtrC family response regulator